VERRQYQPPTWFQSPGIARAEGESPCHFFGGPAQPLRATWHSPYAPPGLLIINYFIQRSMGSQVA
jgi:hypothetical protein